jgi:hypothetical protein
LKSNKPKNTLNIAKTINNNKITINNISIINIKDKLSNNPLAIANDFNTNFFICNENLLNKNVSGKNTVNNKDPLSYL